MPTFNIWYQSTDKRGNWQHRRQTKYTFASALDLLENYKSLAERRPDMYRNVSCDFEDML